LLPIRLDTPASSLPRWQPAHLLLIAGLLAFLLPPMIEVARFNWTTEQGGHGPIVMATGLWLLVREYRQAQAARRPGNPILGFGAVILFAAGYIVTGITGILELQVLMMYGAVVAGGYLIFGSRVLKACWFPIFYLAFALPPPDTMVAVITQPVKIAISDWAVTLLYALGYPVGSSGVIIQIAQFELLVAAACAGLNSLITLSALCLFYVYLRHHNDARAFVTMALTVIPVAILANFVRVIILILVTYYAGEATAQGFIHDFAGIVTFAAALAALLALDALYSRYRTRKGSVAHV
jgi:exosortase